MLRPTFSLLFTLVWTFVALGAPGDKGSPVDIAAFGKSRSWNDVEPGKFAKGIEWDEPRDFSIVDVELTSTEGLNLSDFSLEYWVSSWPSKARGGWTQTDTPWQGSWRRVSARTTQPGNLLQFEFNGLTPQENPNAVNWVGTSPHYRRALKVRLVGNSSDEFKVKALRIYGHSQWNRRDILVQSGCEGKPPAELSFTVYNGRIEGVSGRPGDLPTLLVSVAYTDHLSGSNDRTLITVKGSKYAFGFSVDEVISRRGLYIRSLGIFMGDPHLGDFQTYLRSGLLREGEDIIGRIDKEPAQTLDRARGEIPAFSMTRRSGRHALRYIPLGLPSVREKYGLDFNGNVFINKHGAKAMKEDLARMEWSGEEIYFRVGTGTIPDFRERENSARQSMLEGYLPVVQTTWETEGIEYNAEAFVTTAQAPFPKPWEARGDEATVLLLQLIMRNPGSKARKAHVWYYTTPQEELRLSEGILEARSSPGSENRSCPALRLVPRPSARSASLASSIPLSAPPHPSGPS